MSTLDNVVLLISFAAITIISLLMMESQTRRHQDERDKWARERKDLMDRIQAPNFAAYTGKVIAEIKAEKPKEEVKHTEFVS